MGRAALRSNSAAALAPQQQGLGECSDVELDDASLLAPEDLLSTIDADASTDADGPATPSPAAPAATRAAHGADAADVDSLLPPDYLDYESMDTCVVVAPLTLRQQPPRGPGTAAGRATAAGGGGARVDLVRIKMADGRRELLARKTVPHTGDVADEVRFQAEVMALQACDASPFVLCYRGSRELPDRSELFTEYASGGSVEREMGIAHLAVRPSALLLTDTGRVQLGDLSHAATVDADGPLAAPPAADWYTAPELRRLLATPPPSLAAAAAAAPPPLEAVVSPKADVYSVGALVAMCGLWAGNAGAAAAYQEGRVQMPDWAPADLAAFVEALTAADPAARPNAEAALKLPFLAGLEPEDVLL
ncbi:hypothetical protein GPECTOR_17g805 [Gonium pectorale]|uniref:Protein kinase domain-containing protein n=1 Tax=Gonium pectorale TaxID=33097 RepID=A0A150GK10_GONPE|nr:hypothetical protein GPECTOR_17g805 [Gonium pectorale]|eukprot:KXZ50169.1 hypothetical protein GPECTOR_17g805 [Gonium pectorale]